VPAVAEVVDDESPAGWVVGGRVAGGAVDPVVVVVPTSGRAADPLPPLHAASIPAMSMFAVKVTAPRRAVRFILFFISVPCRTADAPLTYAFFVPFDVRPMCLVPQLYEGRGCITVAL
jgi:hypothetical protein